MTAVDTHTVSFGLFDTSIGRCAVAWTVTHVVGVNLPEATDAATLARFRHRWPNARTGDTLRSAHAAAAVTKMQQLLATGDADFGDTPIHFGDASVFERSVWAITSAIPAGHTLTYGEVARQLGDPTLAQAVGQALGRNPVPLIVPCHRVMAAGGKSGGFSAPGGRDTKLRILAIEGAIPATLF